jgi:hypothetical protein
MNAEAPRRGRPPLPPDAPRSPKTEVYRARLEPQHKAKLQRLGTDWLVQQIERAKEPS